MGVPHTVDLDVQAGREGVHHGRAHPVQAAGGGVRATTELAAGVQLGHDDLDAGKAGLGLDVHGDTAAVVPYLDGTVIVQDDVDVVAVAPEGLVH